MVTAALVFWHISPVCALTTRSAFFKFDRKYIVHPQASASTRVPFRKPAQSIISCDIFTFKGIDSGPYHNSDLKSMREIQFIWLDFFFLKKWFFRISKWSVIGSVTLRVQRANHWSMELDSVTFKQWWFTNFDVSYFSFPSNQLIWVDIAHTRFLVFYDHYRIVSIVDLFSCQDNSNIHFPYKLRERELKEIAEGFNYIKKCHIWSLYSFCG